MAQPPAIFPPSPEAVADANRYPAITFAVRPENIKMRETLARSVVVRDLEAKGASFVQINLTRAFSFPGWEWIARSIPGGSFLVEAPNEQWRRTAIKRKFLKLGGVDFPVQSFQPRHNIKPEPTFHRWVKVRGLPYDLWKDFEFVRIAKELGGFLLDVDPVSKNYIDFTVLRLKIAVPHINAIPLGRHLLFDTPKGPRFFLLQVEIEDNTHKSENGWGGVGAVSSSRSHLSSGCTFQHCGTNNPRGAPSKAGNSEQTYGSSAGNVSQQHADTGAVTVPQGATRTEVGVGCDAAIGCTQSSAEPSTALVSGEKVGRPHNRKEKIYDDHVRWDRIDPAVVNPQKIVLMRKISSSESGKTVITYVPPDELMAAKLAALEGGSPAHSDGHVTDDDFDNLTDGEKSDGEKSLENADVDACVDRGCGKVSSVDPVAVTNPDADRGGLGGCNAGAPTKTYVKKPKANCASADGFSGEHTDKDPTQLKRKWEGEVHCVD